MVEDEERVGERHCGAGSAPDGGAVDGLKRGRVEKLGGDGRVGRGKRGRVETEVSDDVTKELSRVGADVEAVVGGWGVGGVAVEDGEEGGDAEGGASDMDD